MSKISSSVLIIGNEILSGRTQEINVKFIAMELSKIGISLSEVRVVPDIKKQIILALNELRNKYDYVFTTGGIGPTHDDITSECISKALKIKYEINKEAYHLLKRYYPEGQLNEGRVKMTKMPKGSKLIKNAVTVAPGFYIKNIFVLPGVPKIMQVMFKEVIKKLKKTKPIISITINTNLYESIMAKDLDIIQNTYVDCEIGSYPHFDFNRKSASVNVVISSKKRKIITLVKKKIITAVKKLGGKAREISGEK
tara:strand:- start:648 stop:1406 length:759 start_codon:yes stop_codon:yes gene_type:complete